MQRLPPVCLESALPLSYIHLQPAFQFDSSSLPASLLLNEAAGCVCLQQTLSGVSNKTKHPNITSHTLPRTCDSFLHLRSSFSSGEHFPRYDFISSPSSSSWMALWLLFKLDRHRNSPGVSIFPVVGRWGRAALQLVSRECSSTRCWNLKSST